MQAFEDENLSNLLGYYLGYAQHTQQDGGFEGTYQKALLAMTYAKYSKAENIMAYNVEFEEKLKRDTYLMEQLKKDLVDFSNFKVLYQTQNHVDSHQVVGLEACPDGRPRHMALYQHENLLILLIKLDCIVSLDTLYLIK